MNYKEEFDLENSYLDTCIKEISNNINKNSIKIKELNDGIDTELNAFFNSTDNKGTDYEHLSNNDEFKMLSKDLLNDKAVCEILIKENSYFYKMKNIPYFAKIVFDKENYYIGINTLFNENDDILIVDWRAPLADLYYEKEVGDTYYKTSKGIIRGNLSLKRQFIIRDSKLIEYIDNNLMIDDPVLINELSKKSDDKLKNIVSTIQAEQNKAIKADINNNLLVLGVAGSGKTSVAIHRISYLIYSNSKLYDSTKIAILSPNSFFFDYIDNILPSLGEDNVNSFDISALISQIDYNYGVKVQNKEMYYKDLFNDYKTNFKPILTINEINELISKEIVKYIKDIDFKLYDYEIKHEEICNYFLKQLKDNRLLGVIHSFKEMIINNLNKMNIVVSKEEKMGLFNDINHMFEKIDCLAILNKITNKNYVIDDTLEFYDGLYLAYIALKVHSLKDFDVYHHIIIDEVQDYSDIELSLINMLFNCNKTYVGDLNQRLISKFNYDFKNINELRLLNSYRSSKEIFDFLNAIMEEKNTVSVMRHGNKPFVIKCNNYEDEINKIINKVKELDGTSIIICKNENSLNKTASVMQNKLNYRRVYQKSDSRVILATIYEAKGLEFDNVFVIDVDENNYKYDIEANWLYIACSRSMHNLYLLYTNKISRFIEKIDSSLYNN